MFKRRGLSAMAIGAATARAESAWAQSAAYPTRPVRMLIGFPPGGTVDTIGRIIVPERAR